MSKIIVGNKTTVYPMPAFLIGANVDGKPNFMTAAWSGIAGGSPPVITVGIRHTRHTLRGIRQNMTFSVNVPSVKQLKETDYCGMESGSKVDKVAACKFEIFYGTLQTAPLIEQCPVNLECAVMHLLDVGSHILVVGRIENTYVTEDCLTDGKPDVEKIEPITYVTEPERSYRTIGGYAGKAFEAGQQLRGEG
jgi:flavin reductase (DIM6/NTAB) family NADH-FMN oxidoreductase RutF